MLFRNLVTALLKHGKIETTMPKAKALAGWAAKMITLAKRGDLHARRQAARIITEKQVVKKLFEQIAPLCRDRNGGYTRITGLGFRQGDAAPMALIELLDYQAGPVSKPETKKKEKPAKKESPQETPKEKAKEKAKEKTDKAKEKKEKKDKKAKPEKKQKKK
jgi:large subunit ribosomal protein L17